MKRKQKKQSVGILNRGKHNTYIGNKFSGLDVGIQDEGEDTKAIGNKFIKKEKKSGEGQLPGVFIAARRIEHEGVISSEGPGARTEIITEDYKGSGTIKSKNTQDKSKKNWFSMDNPLVWLIFSVLVVVIIYLLFPTSTK